MNKVIEYLNKNKVGSFATLKNGEIMMRPFHFIFERNNQFIFGTASNKEVYKELRENKTAAFNVLGKDGNWVRIRGKVAFTEDLKLKEEIYKALPIVETIYGDLKDSIFQVFCIYDGQGSLHDGHGKIIEEIKF